MRKVMGRAWRRSATSTRPYRQLSAMQVRYLSRGNSRLSSVLGGVLGAAEATSHCSRQVPQVSAVGENRIRTERLSGAKRVLSSVITATWCNQNGGRSRA